MRTAVSKGRAGSTVVLRYGGRAVSISKAAFDGLQWRVGVGIVGIGGGAVQGGGDVGIGRDDAGGCRVKN
jgi:hypothetical protein